ncbi:hypothetical protein PR048_002333 [Dryococelus australis]|uniref:Uncharacterized protein n=1 Tax=Dryococelus australis TaxID=614101 RepID=A0ABQ9IJW7_9NEOP|nr:hypothetical protein PR048_002333 [Dryococelus australis]
MKTRDGYEPAKFAVICGCRQNSKMYAHVTFANGRQLLKPSHTWVMTPYDCQQPMELRIGLKYKAVQSSVLPQYKPVYNRPFLWTWTCPKLGVKTQLGTKAQFSECFNLEHRLTWDTAASDSAMTSEGHVHQSARPCSKIQTECPNSSSLMPRVHDARIRGHGLRIVRGPQFESLIPMWSSARRAGRRHSSKYAYSERGGGRERDSYRTGGESEKPRRERESKEKEGQTKRQDVARHPEGIYLGDADNNTGASILSPLELSPSSSHPHNPPCHDTHSTHLANNRSGTGHKAARGWTREKKKEEESNNNDELGAPNITRLKKKISNRKDFCSGSREGGDDYFHDDREKSRGLFISNATKTDGWQPSSMALCCGHRSFLQNSQWADRGTSTPGVTRAMSERDANKRPGEKIDPRDCPTNHGHSVSELPNSDWPSQVRNYLPSKTRRQLLKENCTVITGLLREARHDVASTQCDLHRRNKMLEPEVTGKESAKACRALAQICLRKSVAVSTPSNKSKQFDRLAHEREQCSGTRSLQITTSTATGLGLRGTWYPLGGVHSVTRGCFASVTFPFPLGQTQRSPPQDEGRWNHSTHRDYANATDITSASGRMNDLGSHCVNFLVITCFGATGHWRWVNATMGDDGQWRSDQGVFQELAPPTGGDAKPSRRAAAASSRFVCFVCHEDRHARTRGDERLAATHQHSCHFKISSLIHDLPTTCISCVILKPVVYPCLRLWLDTWHMKDTCGVGEEIWAALNIEVLRADEGEVRHVWNSAGKHGQGKREIPMTSGNVRHESNRYTTVAPLEIRAASETPEGFFSQLKMTAMSVVDAGWMLRNNALFHGFMCGIIMGIPFELQKHTGIKMSVTVLEHRTSSSNISAENSTRKSSCTLIPRQLRCLAGERRLSAWRLEAAPTPHSFQRVRMASSNRPTLPSTSSRFECYWTRTNETFWDVPQYSTLVNVFPGYKSCLLSSWERMDRDISLRERCNLAEGISCHMEQWGNARAGETGVLRGTPRANVSDSARRVVVDSLLRIREGKEQQLVGQVWRSTRQGLPLLRTPDMSEELRVLVESYTEKAIDLTLIAVGGRRPRTSFPSYAAYALNLTSSSEHENCHLQIRARTTQAVAFHSDVEFDSLLQSRANRVRLRAGSLRIFARGNRAGRCRWSAGLLRDLSPPPRAMHSGAAPYSPRFTSALKTSMLRVAQTSPLQLHFTFFKDILVMTLLWPGGPEGSWCPVAGPHRQIYPHYHTQQIIDQPSGAVLIKSYRGGFVQRRGAATGHTNEAAIRGQLCEVGHSLPFLLHQSCHLLNTRSFQKCSLYREKPLRSYAGFHKTWGSGGSAVRLLASHLGEPGSIPSRVTPRFSQWEIVSDDTTGRWIPGNATAGRLRRGGIKCRGKNALKRITRRRIMQGDGARDDGT